MWTDERTMPVIGPAEWIGKLGDYALGQYNGIWQNGLNDVPPSAGSSGYNLNTMNCCCGKVPPGGQIVCCDDWQAELASLGIDLEWVIGTPCGGGTLTWDPFGTEWNVTIVCECEGGFPVIIDLRIRCELNEAAGVEQYRLYVSCNNPNPPGGFESWDGFPLTQTECPTNENGLSSVQATWGVPAICCVEFSQAGWGGNLKAESP